MGIKSVVYRGSGHGSLRVKTEECKDHRLYHANPPDRDTAKGYKYRFLFIFFLTLISQFSQMCMYSIYRVLTYNFSYFFLFVSRFG